MAVHLSRTSPADMATEYDNSHMGGTMLTPWPETPGERGAGDDPAAKKDKFPKLYGFFAILAMASLGWVGWRAFFSPPELDEEEETQSSTRGGTSSTPIFIPGVNSARSGSESTSSGFVSPSRPRANITARGGSFSGMSTGS